MFRSRRQIEIYEFDSFRLNMVERQLYFQSKPILLSAKSFDILRILVENNGRVVTKEDLIKQVWLNQFIEENNLTVRMSGIRKALGETAEKRFIETAFGHGYRFVARVREFYKSRAESESETSGSIAVLPLINENNQQRLNYLCDGITESLINSLSRLAALKVMSRSTVFNYKGKDVDPLKAGEELGVGAVLVGNLKQVGNFLLISMEVIDVHDGSQLWGGLYKHRASDLFTLQDEIVREVSDSLRIKLSEVEETRITKHYTDSSQAYHLYLKGRYFWNKRTVLGVQRSVQYFRKAIKEDPQFALAYTGLADAFIKIAGYGVASPRKVMPRAQAAALRALEIDNQLAEAHVSLGEIKSNFERDWAGAESSYRRAIEISSSSAAAHHYYSTLLAKLGRLDQAVAEIRAAFEIDPLSRHIQLALGRILLFAKNYDGAIKRGQEMLEIYPEFGPAHGLIGMVYLEQKNYEGAISNIKKLISFSEGDVTSSRKERVTPQLPALTPGPDPEAIGILGYAYGVSGRREDSIKILNTLINLTKQRYVEPHSLALVYIGLKDNDKAFEWLEKGFADRINILGYIKVWSLFNQLRDDSRYDELVKRMGL